MGMIGNQLAAGTALTVANDSFNGNGSTTAFTLSQSVGAATDIEVLVDNVQQSPYDSSYSVSGTTLTFSAAPAAGTNNIYVIYHASKHITTNQVVPDDGSVVEAKLGLAAVTEAKLGAAAVTTAKLHDDAVTHSKLPAGSILQVVNTLATNNISTTSTSDVDTGISINITPKFSTSKLWLLFSSRLYISSHSHEYFVKIKNGSTVIGGGATLFNGSSGDRMAETCNIQGFHSPNSTSQLNYKITHRVSGATGYLMPNSHPFDTPANFVILEIAQ